MCVHRHCGCPTRPRNSRQWVRSWTWCLWTPSASWTWWPTSTPSGPAPSRSSCPSTSCGRSWGRQSWQAWGSWCCWFPSTLSSPIRLASYRSVLLATFVPPRLGRSVCILYLMWLLRLTSCLFDMAFLTLKVYQECYCFLTQDWPGVSFFALSSVTQILAATALTPHFLTT